MLFCFRLLVALNALLFLQAPCEAVAQGTAQFVVTDDVTNADLRPFTATVGRFGNGSRLSLESGFEPIVFRTMFKTTAPAQNRVIAPASVISNYDSWRTGALDGAEVEILRIENGAFRSVRRDKIAQGGFQASGWLRAIPQNRVVAPNRTEFEFTWAGFNRPDVPYYFTVRAVDRRGRLSAEAPHVNVMAPTSLREAARRPQTENALIERETSTGEANLEPPQNLTALLTDAGTVKLTWSPSEGASGYVVYRSDVTPSQHMGHYIQLAGQGPAIQSGDLAILRTKFYDGDRGARLTNRVWSAHSAGRVFRNALLDWPDKSGAGTWHLERHTPGTPVQEPGETYLQIELGAGDTQTIGHWNHSGLDQNWYSVLNPNRRYRFDVWMRSETARFATFEVVGFYGGGTARIAPIRLSLTPDWQRFSGTFDIPTVQPGTRAGQTRLRLTGPGTFDVDNFRVYQDDTPFLAFLPEDVARLRASGMSHLRTHSFIKSGHKTYDLHAFTNPGGVSNINGGNTLPQTLTEIARVEMDPWLQVEPHLSREEWLGLAEYLAAPRGGANQPWAAKRDAQGHGPWVDQFDTILFEVGNETWNRIFAPWTFPTMRDAATQRAYSPGMVYGLYHQYVLDILKDSPHWPALSRKLVPVLGGWSINDYGFDAAQMTPETELVTHGGYNGGWDEKAGPVKPDAQGLFSVLTHVLQTTQHRADRHRNRARQVGMARGAPLFTGTYEAGPGYALNGLNNARVTEEEAALQERAMKSVAAGTATLDAFLTRAMKGAVIQNFFTFGSGQLWSSHARWNKGGQTYPAWDLITLFNTQGLGDLLDVQVIDVPRTDLAGFKRREAVKNAPLVAVYATRNGDQLTLFVMSRRVPGIAGSTDGNTEVIMDLPIRYAESVTRYTQSGNWQSNNVDEQGSALVSQTHPVPGSLPRFVVPALPPGETLVYQFKGVR